MPHFREIRQNREIHAVHAKYEMHEIHEVPHAHLDISLLHPCGTQPGPAELLENRSRRHFAPFHPLTPIRICGVYRRYNVE